VYQTCCVLWTFPTLFCTSLEAAIIQGYCHHRIEGLFSEFSPLALLYTHTHTHTHIHIPFYYNYSNHVLMHIPQQHPKLLVYFFFVCEVFVFKGMNVF